MKASAAHLKPLKFKLKIIALISLALSVWLIVVSCSEGPVSKSTGLSPDIIADYMHRVVKAERTVYGQQVVHRLREEKVIQASENWQEDKTLPLPAQMLRMSSELASQEDSFSFGAISPWNLNESKAPKTDFEQEAMQTVIETGLPFKGYQKIDGKTYFSALYPDKAVSQTCVDCHNQHPVHKQRYPDKVFKVGDVMGGLLINLPLEENT